MSVSGFSVQLALKGGRVLERAVCVFHFCPQRGNIFFQEIFFFHVFLSDEVQFSIFSHCAGKDGSSSKLPFLLSELLTVVSVAFSDLLLSQQYFTLKCKLNVLFFTFIICIGFS